MTSWHLTRCVLYPVFVGAFPVADLGLRLEMAGVWKMRSKRSMPKG